MAVNNYFVSYDNAEDLMDGIAERIDYVTFMGTLEQWNALSTSEKEKYDLVCFNDGNEEYPIAENQGV